MLDWLVGDVAKKHHRHPRILLIQPILVGVLQCQTIGDSFWPQIQECDRTVHRPHRQDSLSVWYISSDKDISRQTCFWWLIQAQKDAESRAHYFPENHLFTLWQDGFALPVWSSSASWERTHRSRLAVVIAYRTGSTSKTDHEENMLVFWSRRGISLVRGKTFLIRGSWNSACRS